MKSGRGLKSQRTAFNRLFALRRSSGLVFRSLGHSATLHSHAHSRHIFVPRICFRKCSLAAQKRRKTVGTLNDIKTEIFGNAAVHGGVRKEFLWHYGGLLCCWMPEPKG
jgi:hypothetical protein